MKNRLLVGQGDNSSARDYTSTTDQKGGIGNASGTTNEVIRDNAQNKTKSSERSRNKSS